MKLRVCGLAMSLSILASSVSAEIMITVEGKEYPLSTLTANCQSMSDNPPAQVACFNAVSKLMDEQAASQDGATSVPDALEALRAVAQYEDDDTGLVIVGTGCNIQTLYYNNYFHISRRNVSSIDLYSAEFDASKLQYDQIAEIRGAQAPLVSGTMEAGASAVARGGVAMESSQFNFAPKSARATIGDYAKEVAVQLEAREGQTFDFVLVHPNRSQTSAGVWSAFEMFVKACKA